MTVKECKNACHPEALAEGTTYVDMLPTHAKETSTTAEVSFANSSCPPLVGDRNLRFRGGQLFERDSSVTAFPQNDCKKKKAGFTLAEVLITLGIIGVVAAMTIPNLMTSFAKTRTETQLKGFYSKINQALRLSMADNGDPDGWINYKGHTYDEEVEFLNIYMFPYMKQLGYESCVISSDYVNQGVCIMLIDGGGLWFAIDENGADLKYFPDAKKMFDYARDGIALKNLPREVFNFSFAKVNNSEDMEVSSVDFVVPYIFEWDGTKEGLKKGKYACLKGCTKCNYCTELIHQNGWKIPGDYPW